jgi:glycosyltransferase involved in cell wall biosynthesis
MHIVHCLTHSDIGGGQEVVFTLVKTLMVQHPDKKYTVILPSGGLYIERFKYLSANVIEAPFDRISIITLLRSYLLFRKLKPDVLHSHGKGAGFYTRFFPGLFLMTKRVHSYHGFHPPASGVRRTLYLFLESFLLKHTDVIVSVSRSEAEDVLKEFPFIREKLKMIPNRVDQDSIVRRSNDALPGEINAFLDRCKGTFIIAMIGREDPVKNYALAFEAIDTVLGRKIPVSFVFVGVNPASSKLANLVKKYPGSIYAVSSLENTSPVMARSNALLITSKKEGAPLVVLESFCLGKPVIGTNVPGIRDLIDPGENGMLCEENSVSISASIEQLQGNSSLYLKLSEGALAAAGAMDVTAWAGQYYSLYENRRN